MMYRTKLEGFLGAVGEQMATEGRGPTAEAYAYALIYYSRIRHDVHGSTSDAREIAALKEYAQHLVDSSKNRPPCTLTHVRHYLGGLHHAGRSTDKNGLNVIYTYLIELHAAGRSTYQLPNSYHVLEHMAKERGIRATDPPAWLRGLARLGVECCPDHAG